ncbi:MAG: mandelate racemase/muconate lactonizing enzyme family protein, partial [SAR202 cluster bacterium]|nr:mandelate racemase/muconate lactonizing enzyme family protein [SAR202 cluster bacterium]
MKITGVRTTLYEYDMLRPLADANGPAGRQKTSGLAVFIDTDEGVTGVAEGGAGARGHIHSYVDNLLVGRDPRGVKGLWKRIVEFVFKEGNKGIASSAISTIDVALWDLKAKADNQPLWKTLGASTRMVKGYASGIDLSLSDEEIGEFYESMAAQGINAGKLKVGLDRESDLRRLGIMRDALATSGKTPVLLIDSNEYWSPKQAIRNIRHIEEKFEITWAEEPARRWDHYGLRKVSEGITAAVATGENLQDISEFTPLIANGGVDIVQVGSGTTGITGAMKVADLAYAFEIPVAMMNCPANFMAHTAAALPNHMMMEMVAVGRDIAMNVDHKVEAGWIVL